MKNFQKLTIWDSQNFKYKNNWLIAVTTLDENSAPILKIVNF
jgi:hypothetical protein